MADGLANRLPAILLVAVGLAVIAWSGAAIYDEAAPFRAQDSYLAFEAEDLEGRTYEFEELSPGARNLTRAALRDEIPTRSPVPPEFAADGSEDGAETAPSQRERFVDYYVRDRGDVHRLGVSANATTVTVVERSAGPTNWEFYAYEALTDREREVVDRAIDSSSTIHGPDAAELPHFDAKPRTGTGQYVVSRNGQPYSVAVEDGTGPRFWLLVLGPILLLGIGSVVVGAIGYRLSATAGPAAALAGMVTLLGPSALTELGVVQPIEEPLRLLVAAPIVAGVTLLAVEVGGRNSDGDN